jgi:hypothetical protein
LVQAISPDWTPTSAQDFLFFLAQLFDLMLPAKGFGTGSRRFGVCQPDRQSGSSVLGTLPLVVRDHPGRQNTRHAAVEGTIAAAKQIDAPTHLLEPNAASLLVVHDESLPFQPDRLPA